MNLNKMSRANAMTQLTLQSDFLSLLVFLPPCLSLQPSLNFSVPKEMKALFSNPVRFWQQASI